MAISAPGLGSGIDVNGLVSKLMAVESQPLQTLNVKEAGYQAKLSAYGSIKGALAQLQTTMNALNSSSAYQAVRASLADATIAQASTGSTAQAGSYSVEVQALAYAQKLKSTTFSDTSDNLGSGTLTIQFGTYSGGSFSANPDKAAQTIDIAAGSSSLAGVRDAINAANVGISASLVNDGSNYRLVLASNDAGTANALKISVADEDGLNTDALGLSRLAYDAATGGTVNMTQTVAAQNSLVVVDGISVSKPTNTVTDAVQGVTLTLAKTNNGSATTLTVTRDKSAAINATTKFVDAWNGVSAGLKSLGAYDAQAQRGAVLQGDATLRSIQNQLRSLVNTPLSPAAGGIATLSDAGISFKADGTLKLDSAKLQKVLDDPTKDLSALFAAVGKPNDSLVKYTSAGSNVTPGSYDVQVTALATRGSAVGGAVAGLTITAGINDTLLLTIDGQAASITLGTGVYTASSLNAELQSRINGISALTAAGSAVTASQSGGVLTITSNRYGSASAVTIDGGNAAVGLLGTAVSTAGIDVAGSIGGVSATGSGQTLSAMDINLRVLGGATGSRGTFIFGRGYAGQISSLLDGIVGSTGPLTSRLNGINSSIKQIGNRRDATNRHLVEVEKAYRAQFNAMDRLVARMNSTSSYLTQQLAALNNNK